MQLGSQPPFHALPRLDRRHAISHGIHGEERGAPRYLATTSAKVQDKSGTHVGFLRDLSANGVFVYSNFQPSIGDDLQIHVGIGNISAEQAAITCRGKVVRVEQPASGAAVGIAMSVTGYEVRVVDTTKQ